MDISWALHSIWGVFVAKIINIRETMPCQPVIAEGDDPPCNTSDSQPSSFDEIEKIVSSMAHKMCGPMLTSVVRLVIDVLGTVIVDIINKSLVSGETPQ